MIKLWGISLDNGKSLLCQSEGRWHKGSQDVAVLEAAPLSAICAYLAAFGLGHPQALPAGIRLMTVNVQEGDVQEAAPRRDWMDSPAITQMSGNAWISRGKTPVLRVPSLAGSPQYLFNRQHELASRCQLCVLDADAVPLHVGRLTHALARGTDWIAPQATKAIPITVPAEPADRTSSARGSSAAIEPARCRPTAARANPPAG